MAMTFQKALHSIFVDYTTDGERVDTKGFVTVENGERYRVKQKIIRETGEILEEQYFLQYAKDPYISHLFRPYILA